MHNRLPRQLNLFSLTLGLLLTLSTTVAHSDSLSGVYKIAFTNARIIRISQETLADLQMILRKRGFKLDDSVFQATERLHEVFRKSNDSIISLNTQQDCLIYKGQLPSPSDIIQRIIPEGLILEPNMDCRKIKISLGTIIQKLQKARDKGYPASDVSSTTKSMYEKIWINYSRAQNKYEIHQEDLSLYNTLSGFTAPIVTDNTEILGFVDEFIRSDAVDVPAFSDAGDLLGSFVKINKPGQLKFQPVSDSSRKLMQIALNSAKIDVTIKSNDWASAVINTNDLDLPLLDIDDFLESQNILYADLPESVQLLLKDDFSDP